MDGSEKMQLSADDLLFRITTLLIPLKVLDYVVVRKGNASRSLLDRGIQKTKIGGMCL